MKVYAPLAIDFGASTGSTAPGVERDAPVRLGLLWNGKPNGDVALEAVVERLAELRPAWKPEEILKGGMPTPLDDIAELAATVDAVIGAPAD